MSNRKKINKCIISIVYFALIAGIVIFLNSELIYAESQYKNTETEYEAFIQDDMDLLTEENEKELLKTMEKITEFGGVAFVSISEEEKNSWEYARKSYLELFCGENGVVFLINMYDKSIYIYCGGGLSYSLTNSKITEISKKVSYYISHENYVLACKKAYSEMLTILERDEVTTVRKYVSNGVLALILGFFVTFIAVKITSYTKKADDSQRLEYINHQYQMDNAMAMFSHTSRKYSPRRKKF